MSIMVNDLEVARRLRAEREATDGAQHDEVWDGVYVISPLPNNEHQLLACRLSKILDEVAEKAGLGLAICGVNVSDRDEG